MIIYVIVVVDKIMKTIRWWLSSKVTSRLMEEECICLITGIDGISYDRILNIRKMTRCLICQICLVPGT